MEALKHNYKNPTQNSHVVYQVCSGQLLVDGLDSNPLIMFCSPSQPGPCLPTMHLDIPGPFDACQSSLAPLERYQTFENSCPRHQHN